MSDVPGGRLPVKKTYKLFVAGKFPRSESGRVYEVTDTSGEWLANAPLGTAKDVRDAVRAARKAFAGWSGATAAHRGQVLYRAAEMLQGARGQFVAQVGAAEGLSEGRAGDVVDAAIDRLVWYAGWTDKLAQIAGASNPVAGPYLNFSTPEPTGVVGVLAPRRGVGHSLLGLVSTLAPVLASGNTAVVVAAERAPLPALTLAEVWATSDLPAGVVNLLSGQLDTLAPALAAHQDVNALDLTGAATSAPERPAEHEAAPETDSEAEHPPSHVRELERAAAENLKRLLRRDPAEEWTANPGTRRLLAFLETKTVWHPVGP